MSNDYKTHSLDEYNSVLRLRQENGWGPAKIFSFLLNKEYDISYGAISDWIYTSKRPFQDKVISKILPQSKFLTIEKAYILGVLCGDGYIRINKSGTGFLIGLDVTDEDFADEFRKCLKKVYGRLPSKNLRIAKSTNFSENPKPRYAINLTSKLAAKDLLNYSKSFKTKEWTVPEEIFRSNLKIKSAFIRGLFDSEGSASLRKGGGVYLSVCSGNEKPLLQVNNILKEDFGINLSVFRDESVTRLKSSGHKNVKLFYEKINFTIKRKRDQLRRGLFAHSGKEKRSYSPSLKKNALELLEKYKDHSFVSQLLNIKSTTTLYDWEKADLAGKLF